ncbi:hypothetical protein ABK040_002630 [Willaertia magna]
MVKKLGNASSNSEAKDLHEPSAAPVKHVVLDDRLFNETSRLLIYDDVQATTLTFDPSNKNLSMENNIVFHPSGLKKRKGASSSSSKKSKEEIEKNTSTSYKILCCCCYFGNKYLKVSFGQVMIAIIICMIALVAYLKFGENIFFFQAVHDLEEIDYYQVLNVTRDSSNKLIKKAHREQTRKWHPDLNPDCGDECVKRMSLISEAYTVLTNDELKSWHERNGLRVPDSMIKKHASRARD